MEYTADQFKTYVIIEFDPGCDFAIQKWLENKLKEPKNHNGAGLLTKFSSNSKNQVH